MGKIAFLFAGQGSQYPGMGKDFYEEIPQVKQFFEQAKAYHPTVLQQMFSGSPQELAQTVHTQPTLFLADFGAAIALQQYGICPDVVAGFSLGEVVAMGVSGILPPQEAFQLVCERGRLMQQAAEATTGSMIAVMRMERGALEHLCQEAGVYPVNYNCPGQIVVSGQVEKMEAFQQQLTKEKARFVPLAVGGPFHTPYMASAAEGLYEALQDEHTYHIQAGTLPVYANKTADCYPQTREEIISLLSGQIANSVKWEDTLKHMYEDGVDTFLSCGPGNALSGFVKKTLTGVRVYAVSDMASLQAVVTEMEKVC